ncbi:RteC domain-containing protein [Pedobacter roseus]|uniref:RteC domain-containing protein n=1 Tax=Pedobacter roseus TaxID=336820 RepID=A0A7G9QH93_9SPHI|nr:RteC domain-containing protein [Pedobacter roseus]QNN42718.1 RteC domain-containing protein [Pedobacter roseus]
MLIPQSEQLYLEMTSKLHAGKNELISDLLRLSSSLEMIESSTIRLNSLANRLGFSSEAEEIFFFKQIKPKFYSWKIFIVEQFNIVSNIPVDTDEAIRNYYIREIDFVRRYFEQNQFLYQYYLNDQSALDEEYFLRRNRQNILPAVNFGEFETKGDYTFAKFRAYEHLREFILTRIKLVYSDPESSIFQLLSKNSNLRWTDDKVKLVELAYGIYFMGSLNNGKADISQVVDILEKSLNVDLGVAYRKFIDISRRKSKGYTVYLDSMRNAINDHIARKLKFN